MLKETNLANGVQLYAWQDERFKTVRISVHMLLPLKKQTAAAFGLLPAVLARVTREYPTYLSLCRKLSGLYGASFSSDVSRMGDAQLLSLTATGLANRYAFGGEDIAGELTDMLCSVLFTPVLGADGLFLPEHFEQEKRQQIETLLSEKNNKQLYARYGCESLLYRDADTGVHKCGTPEQVKALTVQDLTKAWQTALHTAKIFVFVLGNCRTEQIASRFAAHFAEKLPKNRTLAVIETKPIPPVEELQEQTEELPVGQSKLCLALKVSAKPEERIAAQLLNTVLGASPSSKLFIQVREKMSLCYYCSSLLMFRKDYLLLESGVDTDKIELAKEAMLAQLAEMQQGHITEEELREAKLCMCNSYGSAEDYLSSIESYYLAELFCGDCASMEQRAKEVMAISKEQIVEMARRIRVHSCFTVVGTGGPSDDEEDAL